MKITFPFSITQIGDDSVEIVMDGTDGPIARLTLHPNLQGCINDEVFDRLMDTIHREVISNSLKIEI